MAPRASSWANFAQSLQKQTRMEDMMIARHVDLLAAVGSEGFVAARANCRACVCEQACREWLLKGSATNAEFCPNLDFFASLDNDTQQS